LERKKEWREIKEKKEKKNEKYSFKNIKTHKMSTSNKNTMYPKKE
jgi:hypothetical protein